MEQYVGKYYVPISGFTCIGNKDDCIEFQVNNKTKMFLKNSCAMYRIIFIYLL